MSTTQPVILTVSNTQDPLRIDKYLSTHLLYISRSQIQKLIQDHKIRLNSSLVNQPRIKVMPGDKIIVSSYEEAITKPLPKNLSLDILYEDDSLACINKPAGMPVHPAGSRMDGTLVNGLLHQFSSLSAGSHELRPGIVHRLDQGTSGVLIIAKDDQTHDQLITLFKERQVKKVYWALVHGIPPHETGEIDQPIHRHPTERKKMRVHAEGKSAITHYKLVRQGLGGSLVELYPITGRTHQIRVHLKHIGTPVLADPLYGRKNQLHRGQMERAFSNYPGFGLHAKSITFVHPNSGQEISIEAPLPKPFQAVVEEMT